MRRLLMAPLLAAVLLGLAAPVSADPGTATLVVSPNPVPAYYAGAVVFAGCGYPPGGWVDVYATPPGSGAVLVGAGPADAGGCIGVTSAGWVAGPGDYPVAAARQVQTGQTVKLRQLADAVLVVTG